MRGFEQLVPRLAVLLAVCQYLSARPGGTDDPATANAIHRDHDTSNEIHIIKELSDTPESPTTTTDVSTKEASDPAKHESDTSDKSTEKKADLVDGNSTTSVNVRFPHAVLFGGTCGGTIINPTWILTAGHCTLFTAGRFILAGTNNSMDGSGMTRQVKRLVLHPKFSVGPYWLDADRFNIQQVAANWDFLLAELDEPLPLDGTTMAAAQISDQLTVPAGLHVGYAGYGAAHHGDVMRHEMHGMELEVASDATCAQALVQYEPQDMLCTRGRPPRYDSACNGDSGSGLVGEDGKLYGVASWVENDAHRCFNGALVVFSRVASVRDWIRQVTSV